MERTVMPVLEMQFVFMTRIIIIVVLPICKENVLIMVFATQPFANNSKTDRFSRLISTADGIPDVVSIIGAQMEIAFFVNVPQPLNGHVI